MDHFEYNDPERETGERRLWSFGSPPGTAGTLLSVGLVSAVAVPPPPPWGRLRSVWEL